MSVGTAKITVTASFREVERAFRALRPAVARLDTRLTAQRRADVREELMRQTVALRRRQARKQNRRRN